MFLNKQITKKAIFFAFVGLLAIGCSEDETPDLGVENGQELTSQEMETILNADDLTSAVDDVLSDLYIGGFATKRAGETAKNDCYETTYTENGFSVTFTDCSVEGSETLNGTVSVFYEENQNGASFTATFTDFMVGGTTVNGTRRITLNGEQSETNISFTTTSNITVTLEDGSVITENGTKTFTVVFEEGQDTLFNLQGNWTITEGGNTYTIAGNISKQFNCAYWSSGTMNVSKNGLSLDVDFGDGTCDNKATVTYPNGATQEITLD